MTINIQAVNFSSKQQLYTAIEKKVQKLKRLCGDVISIDVKLTLQSHLAKVNKLCGIRLVIPGYDMLSTTCCSSFEEAVATAVEALERQIERRKTRMRKQLLAVPVMVQNGLTKKQSHR